jgi:hypothetical protein
MSKIGKKILSLFLSALMVVTMLPVFAVTASAADSTDTSSGVSEYLTDSSTDGLTTVGTVEWDSDMGAYHFDGNGYFQINDKPLQDVTSSTGFTISFDVYNPAQTTSGYRSVINISDGSSSNYMSIDCGNSYWELYRSYFYVGSSKLGYWTADFGNSSYCSVTGTQMYADQSTDYGKWENIKVIMNADGTYSYYVDNILRATYIAEYSSKNNNNLTQETLMNYIYNFTDYTIGGASIDGFTNFQGYIKNVRLYSYSLEGELDNNLIAHYLTSSDMTYDASPSHNSINSNGSPVWDDNSGATFDGTDDYFDTSATFMNSVTESNGMTFSFLANTETNGTFSRFFDFTTDSSWRTGSSTDYIFYATNGSYGIKYNGAESATHNDSDVTATVGETAMWTVTVLGSNISFYKDGQFIKTATLDQSLDSTLISKLASSKFGIGIAAFADPYYSGTIKDFRIYNKALSESEIIKLSSEILENPDFCYEDAGTSFANGSSTEVEAATKYPGAYCKNGYVIDFNLNPGSNASDFHYLTIKDTDDTSSPIGQFAFWRNQFKFRWYGNSDTYFLNSDKNLFGFISNQNNHIKLIFSSQSDTENLIVVIVNDEIKGTYVQTATAGQTICDYLQRSHNIIYGGSGSDTNVSVTDLKIYSLSYDLSDLKAALTAYENKMNGSIYTNMRAAYTAYVAASQAYDAAYYGENSDVDITSVTTDLITATNNMTSWTIQDSTCASYLPAQYFSGDSSNITTSAADNYNRLLYVTSPSQTEYYSANNDYFTTYLYGPSCVIALWDGTNTPKFGVMPAYKGGKSITANKPRAIACYYVIEKNDSDHYKITYNDSSEIRPDEDWNYRQTTTTFNFTWSQGVSDNTNPIYKVKHEYESKDTYTGLAETTTGSVYKMSGHLSIKPNFDSTQGYKNFGDVVFAARNKDSDLFSVGTANFSNVYVLNYAGYKDVYDKAVSALNVDVENYKNGGLSSLVTICDQITTVDFTSIDTTSDNTAISSATSLGTIISNVLEAYDKNKNSDGSIATTEDTDYTSLRAAMDEYKENKINFNNYSSDSKTNYLVAYDFAKAIMSDIYKNGYNKAASAAAIAADLPNTLIEKVDTSALTSAIDTQSEKGIFESDTQKYTLASWNNLQTAISDAQTVATENADAGKYATTSKTYDFNGTYTFNVKTDNTSNEQTAVNSAATTLNGVALTAVDSDDAYNAFDKAVQYVGAIDKDKYTDEGAAIKAAIADANKAVYLSVDESGYTGVVPDGVTQIKLTASGETDTVTANLLSAVNDINDTNNGKVKQFTAEFSTQEAGSDSSSASEEKTAFYGENFEFSVNLEEGESVVWSITSKDTDGSAKASSKIYNTENITVTADSNIDVVAEITKVKTVEDKPIKVVIQNIYGKTTKVLYVAEASDVAINDSALTVGDESVSYDTVPFYTFKQWKETQSGDTITLRPIYTVSTDYTITVTGGKVSGNASLGADSTSATAVYDSKVTVTADDTENFVAWAVLKDGKYQIASYSSAYTFYVATDENFVPVVKSGDVYKAGGDKLTAANVDSTNTINTDEILYQKLAEKAPFISIMTTSGENSKARAYVRVTEGSNYSSCEVSVTKGSTTKTAKISNILESGQFVVSVNTSTSGDFTFTAYVNYDLTYSGTSLSLRDSSSPATASVSID